MDEGVYCFRRKGACVVLLVVFCSLIINNVYEIISFIARQRFSMSMFVLRNGRVEKIVREVEAEVLPMVVKNAIRSLT